VQQKRFSSKNNRNLKWLSLAQVCQDSLDAVFKTKEFMYSNLLREWPLVVGQEIGRYTLAEKIIPQDKQSILYVKIHPSMMLKSSSWTYSILQRVNQYLGSNTIARIVYRQDNIQHSEKFVPVVVSEEIVTSQDEFLKRHPELSNLPETLKNALVGLAQALEASKAKAPS